MLCRVVLDTSRTRVRTFGSDDAGHLRVRARFREVTLDDSGLPPRVGVITSKLLSQRQAAGKKQKRREGEKEQGDHKSLTPEFLARDPRRNRERWAPTLAQKLKQANHYPLL